MDADKTFYKAYLSITRSIPAGETLCQQMDTNVDFLWTNGIRPSDLANSFAPVDILMSLQWTTPNPINKSRPALIRALMGMLSIFD